MGFWFRIRLGPFGYTVHSRRKRRPQPYGQYKATRDRRSAFAARYKREQIEAAAGGRRALAREEEWLDRVPAYTGELANRASVYGNAGALMVEQRGNQRALTDYHDALEKMLEASSVYGSTLGVAPTERTQVIAAVLREQAQRVSEYAAKWDLYLTKQDMVAKAEAETAMRGFVALSDQASRLLADLARAYR